MQATEESSVPGMPLIRCVFVCFFSPPPYSPFSVLSETIHLQNGKCFLESFCLKDDSYNFFNASAWSLGHGFAEASGPWGGFRQFGHLTSHALICCCEVTCHGTLPMERVWMSVPMCSFPGMSITWIYLSIEFRQMPLPPDGKRWSQRAAEQSLVPGTASYIIFRLEMVAIYGMMMYPKALCQTPNLECQERKIKATDHASVFLFWEVGSKILKIASNPRLFHLALQLGTNAFLSYSKRHLGRFPNSWDPHVCLHSSHSGSGKCPDCQRSQRLRKLKEIVRPVNGSWIQVNKFGWYIIAKKARSS